MSNPRKVLTAREMGEIDRATIESGIPGLILMENAARGVVDAIAEHFAPVSEQRIAVVCGGAITAAMVWPWPGSCRSGSARVCCSPC